MHVAKQRHRDGGVAVRVPVLRTLLVQNGMASSVDLNDGRGQPYRYALAQPCDLPAAALVGHWMCVSATL